MLRATLFYNGRIYGVDDPMERGWVLIQGAHIAAMGSGAPPATYLTEALPIDLRGHLLIPGMLDLHVHGALGRDTMDGTPTSLCDMARFYAMHGVTGFLATTVTAPIESIHAALKAIKEVMAQGTGGAALLGAHLEGPYINAERRGAHEAAWIHPAHAEEIQGLFKSGVIRLVTLAPEIPENMALIRYARAQGAAVAIGHTCAGEETVREAVRLGATQVSHLFNAMEPLHHRNPGAAGLALFSKAFTCQIIADNMHVHPIMLALAYRLKGPEGLLLITDAMAGTGMPDGEYRLGRLQVTVSGGIARGPDGQLAGSTLTMERALLNMMRATGEPLERVLPSATRVPARALGLNAKGEIAVGQEADLVILDHDLNVRLTMVQGEIVFQAQASN